MFTYLVSLEPGGFKTFSHPYDSFWCCVGTGMENHTKYGTNIYLHSESELYVNLFIPSVLEWEEKGLTLRQETEFPASERTRLIVELEQPTELTLKIRRPEWVEDGFKVRVNGKTAKSTSPTNGYVTVKQEWNDGDTV